VTGMACRPLTGCATGAGTGPCSCSPSNLLELSGDDLRREPLEVRKATLASVLSKAGSGLRLNEHMEHDDGELVSSATPAGLAWRASCRRLGSRYRSGRSPDWLKMKNPDAPPVKREAEEDWGKKGWQ
jgi:ATP-dependent DNA ligase